MFSVNKKRTRSPLIHRFFQRLSRQKSLRKGLSAYSRKQFVQAKEYLQPICDLDLYDYDVAQAQYYIGLMYFYGQGTQRNVMKACFYLNKALQRGESRAAHFILSNRVCKSA